MMPMKKQAFASVFFFCMIVSTRLVIARQPLPDNAMPTVALTYTYDTLATEDNTGQTQKLRIVLVEAIKGKNVSQALIALDNERELLEKTGNMRGVLMVLAARFALFERQGEIKQSISELERIKLQDCQDRSLYQIHCELLGIACLRSGDYKQAILVMGRQIKKITNEINRMNKGENYPEWASTLHACLASCFYFRALANYILGNIDISFINDISGCIDEIEKAKLPGPIDMAMRAKYRKFLLPLSESLEDDKKIFQVVPAKKQRDIFVFPEDGGAELTMNFEFDFEISYIDPP